MSSLQQQVEELQQAAESSQAAHKQVVDQLKQALSDKHLVEQQLEAVMLQGPAGSSLPTALTVHFWIDCAANLFFQRSMSTELVLHCLFVFAACLLPF